MNTKELKPGLVAFNNHWPGNVIGGPVLKEVDK